MIYKVIMYEEDIIKKTIYCGHNSVKAKKYFNKQLEKNIEIPLQFIRKKNNLKRTNYTLVLEINGVKSYVSPIYTEEKFKVYGFKNKMNVKSIISILTNDIKYYCAIYKFNRYLVFYNFQDIEIINTKCMEDCNRLYTYLKTHFKNIHSFLFLGNLTLNMKTRLKPIILEKTKLSEKSLFRKRVR